MELAGHLIAVHASQGVHNIKGEGLQLVDPLHQAQKLQVRIEGSAHRLQKHLVPLCHHGAGPGKGPVRLLPVEGEADSVDIPLPPGRQLVRRKLPLPHGDHGYEHGPARPLGQQGGNVPGAAEQGAGLPPGTAGEEPALDDVDAAGLQLIQNRGDGPPAKFPVVDIAPIPQGAVQNLYAHVRSPPCPLFAAAPPAHTPGPWGCPRKGSWPPRGSSSACARAR